MQNKSPLLASLAMLAGKGARFTSFTYTAKGSGETARHVVALGVNVERAYRRDLALLEAKLPTLTGVDAVACGELIASLQKSLTQGIGQNEDYTCKDVYQHVCAGVKIHKENGSLHVFGFTMGKTVIAEGVHKKVNSSEKTLAKKKLQKGMKTGKFRQFTFDGVTGARIEGKTLTFE